MWYLMAEGEIPGIEHMVLDDDFMKLVKTLRDQVVFWAIASKIEVFCGKCRENFA